MHPEAFNLAVCRVVTRRYSHGLHCPDESADKVWLMVAGTFERRWPQR